MCSLIKYTKVDTFGEKSLSATQQQQQQQRRLSKFNAGIFLNWGMKRCREVS